MAVNFTGEIYPGSDFERALDVMAWFYGGANVGGGTDFQTRDADYGFDDAFNARTFARHARRFKRVTQAVRRCGHCGAES